MYCRVGFAHRDRNGGQSPPFYEECFVNPLIRLFAYSFIVVFSLHTFSRYIAQ